MTKKTKKIKNLTEKEIERLCEAQNCDTCPYRFFQVKIANPITQTEDGYSICLFNLKTIMESEVEIDDINNR